MIDTITFVDDEKANYSYNSNLGRRFDVVLVFDGMKKRHYAFQSTYYDAAFHSGFDISK